MHGKPLLVGTIMGDTINHFQLMILAFRLHHALAAIYTAVLMSSIQLHWSTLDDCASLTCLANTLAPTLTSLVAFFPPCPVPESLLA